MKNGYFMYTFQLVREFYRDNEKTVTVCYEMRFLGKSDSKERYNCQHNKPDCLASLQQTDQR